MTEQELYKIAEDAPHVGNVNYRRFCSGAFLLREKGYTWKAIAELFKDTGEDINVPSFCSMMSRAYNKTNK